MQYKDSFGILAKRVEESIKTAAGIEHHKKGYEIFR